MSGFGICKMESRDGPGTVNVTSLKSVSCQQFQQLVDQELGPKQEEVLHSQLPQVLLAPFLIRLAKGDLPARASFDGGGKGVQLDTKSAVQSELFLCRMYEVLLVMFEWPAE